MNPEPVVAASVSEQSFWSAPSARSLLQLAYLCVLLMAGHGFAAGIKWNSSFNESYLSEADDNRIPFRVKTPPRGESGKKYPLVVALKGSLRVAPSERFPFIEVRPSRGNIWGYRAISTYDAMQVIAHMKRRYPVDPDRVYLVGSSAGASGAMHLASLNPDQFAAVVLLVAAGNNYPIANFLNLPVAIHHGAKDWTSAICDARVQYQKMKEFGCPVILKEYPNAGHSIPRPHEPIMKWLFAQKRNRSPERVAHSCESPRFGRSYWIEINEFADPHRPASVDARLDGDKGVLQIQSTNVIALTVHRTNMPARFGEIWIGRQAMAIPVAKQTVSLKYEPGQWAIGNIDTKVLRPYVAGATANLLQGEPLLVVYGTSSGSPERVTALRAAAQKIAGCGGPNYGSLRQKFPVIADTDLTSEHGEEHNLILVGTPQDNSVTRRLLPFLPLAVSDGLLQAGGRTPLPLKERVMSLLHFNPEHPQRLIYLLAPFADAAAFSKAAQKHLVGSDGFERGSQGDLVVQDLNHRVLRQMQLGKDWKWKRGESEQEMPNSYQTRDDLARLHLATMRKKSGADFALWWGPADEGMWGADFNFLKHYDPKVSTKADLAIERRQVETMLGSVTGAELKQIWNRWGSKQELLTVPKIENSDLRDEQSYQLILPMDFYIKFGQRRKNLSAPTMGPLIDSKAIVNELFQ